MHDKYRFKFNPESLIDLFGGASRTTEVLNEMGANLGKKSVQKMRERGVMQGDAIATLMIAGLKIGKPINLYEHILERTE